jgi:prepilin-type N-terminal cleavage/methylation domain-containing protein
MKTNKRGFSFVELMIVVAIMSILSVVSMVSYLSVTRRARDSRRISDLQKMAMALEMARSVDRIYPASAADLVTKGFIKSALPKDPKTELDYEYTQSNGGYSFTINAILEDVSSSETGSTLYTVTNP